METPRQIRDMAAAKGMTIPELCKRAGLKPSIWYKWNRGAATTVASVQKMLDAIQAEPAPE